MLHPQTKHLHYLNVMESTILEPPTASHQLTVSKASTFLVVITLFYFRRATNSLLSVIRAKTPSLSVTLCEQGLVEWAWEAEAVYSGNIFNLFNASLAKKT